MVNHSAKSYLHSRTKKNIFLLRKHGIIIFERESACICITTYCMSKVSVLSIYTIIFVCQKVSLCSSWLNLKIPNLRAYVGELLWYVDFYMIRRFGVSHHCIILIFYKIEFLLAKSILIGFIISDCHNWLVLIKIYNHWQSKISHCKIINISITINFFWNRISKEFGI